MHQPEGHVYEYFIKYIFNTTLLYTRTSFISLGVQHAVRSTLRRQAMTRIFIDLCCSFVGFPFVPVGFESFVDLPSVGLCPFAGSFRELRSFAGSFVGSYVGWCSFADSIADLC